MSALPPQVRLANEIAIQFHHQPADQAATAIATHLRMFWDPRMRAELITRAATDPTDLDPLVVAAARLLAG